MVLQNHLGYWHQLTWAVVVLELLEGLGLGLGLNMPGWDFSRWIVRSDNTQILMVNQDCQKDFNIK